MMVVHVFFSRADIKSETVPSNQVHNRQSARLAYLSWKIEIGRDWYRSQIGRDLWAKVKMCTPVHGLSGFSAIKQTESPCTGVHIFTFAPESPSNLASVPISSNFDFPA